MPANRDRPAGASGRGRRPAQERRTPNLITSLIDDGQLEYLAIARIVAIHGIHGEMRAEVLTDFPERFHGLKSVHVGRAKQPFAVESTRPQRNQVLMKLAGVDSVKEAEALRGELVFVSTANAVPLAEGQFYWHQIIGLEVWTADGQQLGRIVEIVRTGSNDVYVVRSKHRELLIPAIDEVVKQVDVAHGRMVVELIPGLVD